MRLSHVRVAVLSVVGGGVLALGVLGGTAQASPLRLAAASPSPGTSTSRSASTSPSPYSATLPNARDVQVADAAATFPFSTRLMGSEIVGLAVLAAAIAIAIARFSLRRPKPQHGKDSGS